MTTKTKLVKLENELKKAQLTTKKIEEDKKNTVKGVAATFEYADAIIKQMELKLQIGIARLQ